MSLKRSSEKGVISEISAHLALLLHISSDGEAETNKGMDLYWFRMEKSYPVQR